MGLKIAEIVTDTRSATFAGASRWWFERGRCLWELRRPTLTTRGTRVQFHLTTARKWSILDVNQLREMLLRHYLPLFLPKFVSLYRKAGVYPRGVKFTINGIPVAPDLADLQLDGDATFNWFPSTQQLIGVSLFVLTKSDLLPTRPQGVALCTYGKVIKWDWLDKHPRQAARITGVVEVPQLVECLTTNKADFVKHGREGRQFSRLRSEIKKEFSKWLESIGEVEPKTERRDDQRLAKILNDILDQLPDLGEFFSERRQKLVAIAKEGGEDRREMAEGAQRTRGTQGGSSNGGGVPTRGSDTDELAAIEQSGKQPVVHVRRRVHSGLSVAFLNEGEDKPMSRMEGDTVFVNEGHPAYRRARGERWLDYHNLWAVATALVTESSADPTAMFAQLSRFFRVWGGLR